MYIYIYIYIHIHIHISVLFPWFCYQLIAKPGNRAATVPWPDPHTHIYIYIYIDKNVFKTTRSFCYQWFHVSTLQANANRPFMLSSMKRTTYIYIYIDRERGGGRGRQMNRRSDRRTDIEICTLITWQYTTHTLHKPYTQRCFPIPQTYMLPSIAI